MGAMEWLFLGLGLGSLSGVGYHTLSSMSPKEAKPSIVKRVPVREEAPRKRPPLFKKDISYRRVYLPLVFLGTRKNEGIFHYLDGTDFQRYRYNISWGTKWGRSEDLLAKRLPKGAVAEGVGFFEGNQLKAFAARVIIVGTCMKMGCEKLATRNHSQYFYCEHHANFLSSHLSRLVQIWHDSGHPVMAFSYRSAEVGKRSMTVKEALGDPASMAVADFFTKVIEISNPEAQAIRPERSMV